MNQAPANTRNAKIVSQESVSGHKNSANTTHRLTRPCHDQAKEHKNQGKR